ncbi:hypothetical protein AMATHDRAFT_46279 [Amanita thiersii Skay4041]|uniref:U4/U6.U5 small nuclear ribonucleoprotein 27kDa protein domain-containing protein n=1 Tax=Amanita thiersii Skay4041 TaxID=703135 RepID=A0A2A9NVS4_9AGAR|nr:hypothetical protein AMATHDRAFT_46279 [Amanita thiersii Skay4041]
MTADETEITRIPEIETQGEERTGGITSENVNRKAATARRDDDTKLLTGSSRRDEHPTHRDSEPPARSGSLQDRLTSNSTMPATVSLNKMDTDATASGGSNVEEGEEMDAVNDEDTAMMAAMGLSGFGSTKGKHVAGNQEGVANVKKIRTWRQYMNRRGGFNRSGDKLLTAQSELTLLSLGHSTRSSSICCTPSTLAKFLASEFLACCPHCPIQTAIISHLLLLSHTEQD